MEKDTCKEHLESRRKFVKTCGLALGATIFGAPLFSFFTGAPAEAAIAKKASLAGKRNKKGLGIALVGLGQYSANQLAPALQETEHCHLAGIVTGTPEKAEAWQKKYDIPEKNIYNYENFDSIAENDDIDVVYVVLPTGLHAEYTIRAARAKKHVICEKPMARNVQEAESMIRACEENGVRLAIGYRLHFEPFHQRVMELGQEQVYGKVERIKAVDNGDKTNGNLDVWRLDKELAGGGPLMDLGVYCVQAACYTTGKTPIAVTAEFGEVTEPEYFYDVEQSITWTMEFDDGAIAECESSYADDGDSLSVTAKNGSWKVEPAFGYDGKQGETSDGKMNLPNITEQVRQMDSQTQSFSKNMKPQTPGEMGLRDIKILMAIYESARAGGKRVEVNV